MILNEVSAGKDAEAHPDESRELISLGMLERAGPSPETGHDASIDTIREALGKLDARRTELQRMVRSRRGGLFKGHGSLYRKDPDYRKAWDELQTVETQERELRTRVVDMVQATADAAATGAVEGTAVRVTYRGRELLVTMEPRLGRVGGKELPEFIEEIETIKGHFERRATRAQRILKRISPKVKDVDEIHLRLAAVGLAGRTGDADEVAGLFVRAHRGIVTKRKDSKEPAYVSLAETLVLNARDGKHLDGLVAKANDLIDHKWDRAFSKMDEVRATAILLSCKGGSTRLVLETKRMAREECRNSPSAGAFLACASLRDGEGEATMMEYRRIRDRVATDTGDVDQAVTAAALMAAAGLDTEGVLGRWAEAVSSLEAFDGAVMDLPAAMIAILPVNVAEALDNIRLASSSIYAHKLSLGGVENLSLGVKMLMHSSVQAVTPDAAPGGVAAAPSVLALAGVPAAAVLTVSAGLLAFHALSLHELAIRDFRFHPVHSHYVYG
jgi:hypothetical protein